MLSGIISNDLNLETEQWESIVEPRLNKGSGPTRKFESRQETREHIYASKVKEGPMVSITRYFIDLKNEQLIKPNFNL